MQVKQIRIKQWFLDKNALNHYGNCGRKQFDWWEVTKETEKAYHVNEMEICCWRGGWLPKSAVVEERIINV
jgi:hypothetical protein